MIKRSIEIRRFPDLYYFNQDEAERFYRSLHFAYSDLRQWLPQLEELKHKYLTKKQGYNLFRDFEENLSNLPFGAWLFPVPCGCMLFVYLLIYLPVMLFYAIFSSVGIESPASKRRMELVRFTNSLRELPPPELKKEKILKIEEVSGKVLNLETEDGNILYGREIQDKYKLAGSPEYVYRLTGRFGIFDSLGRQMNTAEILEYFRQIDSTSRQILR